MDQLWANKAGLMALAFVAGLCGAVQAQEQKVGALAREAPRASVAF